MLKQFVRFIIIIWSVFIVMVLSFIAIGTLRNNDVISFTAVFDNRTDIYIYDPVSRELTNITESRFSEYAINWSNTGILSYTESGNPARTNDSLYIMNRPGDARLIDITETLLSYGIVWSPDARKLAYYSSHPRNISDLYLLSFPDETVTNITQTETISESNPFWLADGEHLVYQQDGNLYTIHIATGERRLLADMPNAPIEDPVLSPDGRFVAFYTQNWESNQAISRAFILDTDSTEIEALDLPEIINSPLSWSPDSEKFALIAEDNNLLIYTLVTRQFEKIEGENRRFSPAWSPGGRWIAYIENRELRFYDLETDTILKTDTGGRVREPLIWRP